MKAFVLLLSVFVVRIHGAEKAESFVVEGHDQYFKVVAPESFSPEPNLIIENKMLTKLYGQIETTAGRVVTHVSIEPKKFKSVALKLKKGEGALFVPLSPPFQKVELAFGRNSYEIPPQK